MDPILEEVGIFKRTLDSRMAVSTQTPEPPAQSTRRFTQLPEHPLVFSGETVGEYRYPGLPGNQVTVVLAGIGICGCVTGYQVTSATINGTYTLLYNSGTSFWEAVDVGSYTMESRANTDCTGSVTGTAVGTFTIRASKSSGKWSVFIDAIPSPYDPLFEFQVFNTTTAENPGDPISNANACSSGGFQMADGTATVNP